MNVYQEYPGVSKWRPGANGLLALLAWVRQELSEKEQVGVSVHTQICQTTVRA